MNRFIFTLLTLTILQTVSAMLPGDEYWYKNSKDYQPPTPQEKLYEDFWDCIKDGHKKSSPEKIEALVAAGCDINAYYCRETHYSFDKFGLPTRSFDCDTALTYFAKHGPAHVYELLIHLGADVNLPNKKTGDTPLIIAFKASHYRLCELLIKSGADVNAKNNLDETAILYAANHNHWELFQLLLAHSADINTKSKTGWTPLLLAARNKNKPLCKLLLKQPQMMKTRIISLLCCLRQIGKQNERLKFLYNQSATLLRPHLAKFIIHPQELLTAKDILGKTAYDHWPVEWLKPIKKPLGKNI